MQGMSAAEIRASISKATSGNTQVPVAPSGVTGMFAAIGNKAVDAGRSLLGGIVDSVKKVLPTAVSTAQAAMAQLSYSGSTGNFQTAEETITLVGKFMPLVDTFPEKIGSPLYKPRYINTLSGFVLCKDAVVNSATATENERAAIEAFMNGGFFYE